MRTINPAFLLTVLTAKALPLCRNSTLVASLGHWAVGPSRFLLREGSPCWLPSMSGLGALGALGVNTTVVFIGDSLLREFYHAFIEGTVRGRPVIIDPVFGRAQYRADLDHSEDAVADSYNVLSKHNPVSIDFSSLGLRRKFVELSYIFYNRCDDVRLWLERAPSTLSGRRVVIVTNIGASTIRGNLDHLRCVASGLPSAFIAASNSWGPGDHHFVMMNQPTEHNRFKGISKETLEAVKRATSNGLDMINRHYYSLSPRRREVAWLLDYNMLLSRSFLDPSAPADAMYPLSEDRLHYGCKWLHQDCSKKFDSTCAKGLDYPPLFVKGARAIEANHSDGPALVLECHAYLFRALGSIFLSGLAEVRSHSLIHSKFDIKTCYPEYDAVPCPLYPKSPVDIWGGLSENDVTRHNQQARLLSTPGSGNYFDSTGSSWCEAALQKTSREDIAQLLQPSGQEERQDGRRAPIGAWCALPATGLLSRISK